MLTPSPLRLILARTTHTTFARTTAAVVLTPRTASTATVTPTVAITTHIGRVTRTSTAPARRSTPPRCSRKSYLTATSALPQARGSPGANLEKIALSPSGPRARSSSSSSRTARRSSTPTLPGPVLRATSSPRSGARLPSRHLTIHPASTKSAASLRWTMPSRREWSSSCLSGMM